MRCADTVSHKIVFTNQEGPRVGIGVKTFREHRLKMTLPQLAEKLGIEPSDLDSLEKGYAPVVDRKVLEEIAELVGVSRRYNRLSDDRLLDIFTCATSNSPPKLI